jgi:sulfite reductase (NADPH) flavoprotein alpha-component
MTGIPFIPETAPFSAEQRAWLNGFLAGLFAQAPDSAMASSNAVAKSGEPLLVLFGSQTGSAEALARRCARESESHDFAPRVAQLNDYDSVGLPGAKRAVIISSTWGDGDPPDNAAQFWNWLSSASAPRLEQLHFAVLGLGDRNYSDFCGAAKKFDARLEALGAKRIAPRGECDTDYETPAASWLSGLWDKLGGNGVNGMNGPVIVAPPPPNGAARAAPAYGKSNPFPAKLLRTALLNKPGSAKEVRHYELALNGSGLDYEVGDALGVVPINCPELVNEILAALKADPNETVKCGNDVMPLRQALTRHLDITKPTQELLAAVAECAPESGLAPLLAPEKREALKQWLWGRHVIDLLALLPAPMPTTEFVNLLKGLAPRLYSIASSPKAHAGEVHLTVGVVRYESHGRGRKGVASTFLADRVGNTDFVKVFVQPSHGFRPPANGDTPMIMVGPGTGIAPFRAFLEERAATGSKGRNWLFFGDQKRETDFLYDEQLAAWQKSGLLTRLDLAFSRDQAGKIYVQDRMQQNAAELWSWLEAGAHFYVCGDASRMAKDVDAALHRIVESAGGKSADDAGAYVARLRADKRYQRDVY